MSFPGLSGFGYKQASYTLSPNTAATWDGEGWDRAPWGPGELSVIHIILETPTLGDPSCPGSPRGS